MKTQDVVILMWDDPENFKSPETQRRLGGKDVFPNVIQFRSKDELIKALGNLSDEANLVFVCHVKVEDFSLYRDFINSRILKEFNIPSAYFVSSDAETANLKFKKEFGSVERILYYNQLTEGIEADNIRPIKRSYISTVPVEITKLNGESPIAPPQCDYVIVTALEIDEMEEILPLVKKVGEFKDEKHLVEYGHLTSNKLKKIAYASQVSTGMIDASVLATKMIMLFKPKFVIMAGVLGGKPAKTKIGDIVVSTKVFTIDKGKITNAEFEQEIESSLTDNAYTTKLKRHKEKIRQYIKANDRINKKKPMIHFEPIACVRQVIDKKGFFVKNITTRDRKTIAIEMESYGITRSCELANDGKAIPIIIKSVMDNTQKKNSKAKRYAAWTSAMFIKYALKQDLI